MTNGSGLEVRVRLRHSWITLIRFPLTPEQAESLDRGGKSSIQAANPLDITFGKPVCERCQIYRHGAPDSCPGEPVSYAPDGGPQFG